MRARRLGGWLGIGVAVGTSVAMSVSCLGNSSPLPQGVVTTGGKSFQVELLLTMKDREDALERRARHDPFKPFLIGYPRDRHHHYHTEGIGLTVDVAFVNRDGKLVDVQSLPAYRTEGITNRQAAAYAIFVAPGDIKGVQEGSTVEFSKEIREASMEDLPLVQIGQEKKAKVWVELAGTYDTRSRGLMHRTVLTEQEGMLFLYSTAGSRAYYMKNMRIPISLAYIGEDLKIGQILARMEPGDEDSSHYTSSIPARYVLEANVGWFERNGVAVGMSLNLPESILKSRVD